MGNVSRIPWNPIFHTTQFPPHAKGVLLNFIFPPWVELLKRTLESERISKFEDCVESQLGKEKSRKGWNYGNGSKVKSRRKDCLLFVGKSWTSENTISTYCIEKIRLK